MMENQEKLPTCFFKIIFRSEKNIIFRWDFLKSSSRDSGESIQSNSGAFVTLQTLQTVPELWRTLYVNINMDFTTIQKN